ncbi:hypothetical protein [Celerinatantimonas diazotrophica]|uniref:Uncharacterized protein n=1 Tax=Celerinatantimonas diazotrophica TaxID=412034 RepID=A0A4R1JN57_9GAMM|nr:hypothetical protein [Celerinatantimonas diazotrophica]TCK51949.1 hypothetical protein EV690_2042 [Celerinatantimonas diazotrophica]CAG9296352.1 hypothetical protein CEDIAZO_01501 [Celerinatantimonas diazotrophica]
MVDFKRHPPKAGTLIKLKGPYRRWLEKSGNKIEKAHLSIFAKIYLMKLAKKHHKYINFNSLQRLTHPAELAQLLNGVCENHFKGCQQAQSKFSDIKIIRSLTS